MNVSSPSPADSASPATSPSFDFSGAILRKKNVSAEHLKVAIQEDGQEKSTTVYLPRRGERVCAPADFDFLQRGAVVRVRGSRNAAGFSHVVHCQLVRCAPNVKLIKEILGGENHHQFAAVLGMDEEELRRLVEHAPRKQAVHRVVEALTGLPAKAPPRYRPGRVRPADLAVLERKEAEGRREGSAPELCDDAWRLCRPRRPDDGAAPIEPRRESVVNLPAGAGDSISAHHTLTRAEYLETKKNHQAAWFVSRLRRFEGRPTRFLDVGGGRGDLAVQIAAHFPSARVVVVDRNERSVAAGREYAAECGVDDRIEFCCLDFAEYAEDYEAGRRGGRVDCVVALHACGDLSDLALAFAAARGCDFIVCPCCYPKRYLAPFVPPWRCLCAAGEADTLTRLVELDDHRELSRRAMLVVNSMRRAAFGERCVELEEFDSKISGRNMALVGLSEAS